MTSQDLYRLCINAEYLYNRVVQMYKTLDLSHESTERINQMSKRYNQVLETLNSNGIGGVRINGIFRFTNKENCAD